MEKRLLSAIADFARKTYIDIAKDPHEYADAHMTRCYIEGLIRALSQDGKDVAIIDRKDGSVTILKTALKK